MVYACCPRCSARIPAAQLSKGVRNPANKGYWYQRCPRCSWFQWLAFRPDEPPPTSDNHLDSGDPGGSSPPIPPTEFPLDPELYYEGLAGLPRRIAACNSPHRNHHQRPPSRHTTYPRAAATPHCFPDAFPPASSYSHTRTHAVRRHVAEVHRQVVQTAVQE
ncbi:hypothetical protein HMN09_00560700 [Mycena chlorophos]|uniref:Uncharacterized protein n=1 Tax=Mycena chlorophos TaxID=658473 RepID=A0A8H6TCE1_MYCCL|nr:hypothetical protein HMN09_00560700 [Mycena chlorophos]